MNTRRYRKAAILLAVLATVSCLQAQNTAFTYQGLLTDGDTPANGNYEIQFGIYDSPTGLTAMASLITATNTPVTNGLFTVVVDFGPGVFAATPVWLGLGVKRTGEGPLVPYSPLTPRSLITPAPQAQYATLAGSITAVSAASITGSLASAQLPPNLLTNGAVDVTLAGTFSGDGSGLTNVTVSGGISPSNVWLVGGNTLSASKVLGSLNNQPVDIWVNSQRALRLAPTLSDEPNLIGGSAINNINNGAGGAVIAGGDMQLISSDLSAIGGGWANLIKTNSANSVIAGGEYNAVHQNSSHSVIAGGGNNLVSTSSPYATVAGGYANTAAGGYSFAAGNRAKALHTGSFVWGDSTAADVASSASNQFIIRASGGVAINRASPGSALDVNGTVSATSFTGAGNGLTNIPASAITGLGSNFWQTSGNAGFAAGTRFLGTTDGTPLDFRVNNGRALRLEDAYIYSFGYESWSANILAGYSGNTISSNLLGATVAGGGRQTRTLANGTQENPNSVTGHYGTVGGGYGNLAGTLGTVPGGHDNKAIGFSSFAAGGGATVLASNAFLWSDGTMATSSTHNSFGVYASAGVSIMTAGKLDVRDPSSNTGTLHVGSTLTGGDSKLVQFGDGDYVHVGENGVDDRLELKAGTFFFTHDASEKGRLGIGTNSPQAMVHIADAGSATEPQLQLTETASGNYYARLRMKQAANAYWDIAVGGSGNSMTFGPSNDTQVMTLTAAGDLTVNTLTLLGGADLAEPFQTTSGALPSGTVVVIDEVHPGQLKASDQSYDTRVAGVVSGAEGIRPGIRMQQQDALDQGQSVALTGRVYVRAEALRAAIKPGDLLTTSVLPGRAMKATDHTRAQGAILGKAMTALPSGEGMVLVLVTLQ